MICEEKEFAGIKYCLYKPENFDGTKKYPTIFFTHGAGSRGDDLEIIKKHSVILKLTWHAANCVIFAPQCATDTWFDKFESLIALAKHAYSQPFVEQKRFYGSGVSMGGYGMFQLMSSVPELFAAGIICCGGGMYWNAARLKGIPIRAFHGALDTTVLPEESVHMVAAVNNSGGKAELTVYPDMAHNSWERAFADDEMWKWMFSQKRG